MKTTAGRKVFRSPKGEIYSERTITVPTWFGWVTTPTVDKDGKEWGEDSMIYFLNQYGPIDFVTGAILPVFPDQVSASRYAEKRSESYDNQVKGLLFGDE